MHVFRSMDNLAATIYNACFYFGSKRLNSKISYKVSMRWNLIQRREITGCNAGKKNRPWGDQEQTSTKCHSRNYQWLNEKDRNPVPHRR